MAKVKTTSLSKIFPFMPTIFLRLKIIAWFLLCISFPAPVHIFCWPSAHKLDFFLMGSAEELNRERDSYLVFDIVCLCICSCVPDLGLADLVDLTSCQVGMHGPTASLKREHISVEFMAVMVTHGQPETWASHPLMLGSWRSISERMIKKSSAKGSWSTRRNGYLWEWRMACW